MSAISSICTSGTKTFKKGANIKIIAELCFSSGKLTLNVGYLLRFLIIFISKLKCGLKKGELIYNVGCLYLIDES